MKTFEDLREDLDRIINGIALDYMNFQNETKDVREQTLEELSDRFEPLFNDFELKYQTLMDSYSDLHKKHGTTLRLTIKELQDQYFEHEKY